MPGIEDLKRMLSGGAPPEPPRGVDALRAMLTGTRPEAGGGRGAEPRLGSPEAGETGPQLPIRNPANRPAVCLSDIGELRRTVSLPEVTVKMEGEGGESLDSWDSRRMNWQQATRACLEMLDSGVKTMRPFSSVERAWLKRYYERVREDLKDDKDPRYVHLQKLAELVPTLHNVYYTEWGREDGGKGGKHGGCNAMIKALDKLNVDAITFLLGDPQIESGLHRIKGNVSDPSFVSGEERGEKLGNIYGGEIGAAEKVSNYLRMFLRLGSMDGASQVNKSSYTEYVLAYPMEYFGRAPYEPTSLIEGMIDSTDGTKQVIFVVDTHVSPSAFHNKAMSEAIWRNFTPDNLGWKNIGRMLALVDGPSYRDFRSEMAVVRGADGVLRQRDGFYQLQDFLLASDEQQIQMAKSAWNFFHGVDVGDLSIPDGDRRITKEQRQNRRWQKRIVQINSYRTYYLRTRNDPREHYSGWGERKSVLCFDEDDLKGNHFVDIGSFKFTPEEMAGNLGNADWTDMEYAYRDQDDMLNIFCDTSKLAERLGALKKFLGSDCNRHLLESFSEGRRISGLGYERRKKIMHFGSMLSRMYEVSFWDSRRHGRDRMKWAQQLNPVLREFYDLHRYRVEWEDSGTEGIDWTNVREMFEFAGYEERLGKVLAKFERPEVWIEWLRTDIGLVDKIKELFPTVPTGWVPPSEWRRIGVTDYHEYLTYNALVSFVGFKVQRAYLDRDYYGNLVPRVRFDLDFTQGEKRSHGGYFKGILTGINEAQKDEKWKDIVTYLIGGKDSRGRPDPGKLNDPMYSSLLEFWEKLNEENFIDSLIEKYQQNKFDKNPRNWVVNRWGRRLKHYERWNQWALIKRQMKYTVGNLAEEGWYVHDQIEAEYEKDEHGRIILDENGTPRVKNIPVDAKGIPDIGWRREGWDHVASMSLGTAGLWRPPRAMMGAPHNYPASYEDSDPKVVEARINEGIKDQKQRNRALRESWYRTHAGMGEGGEEKQVSWMPLYYNKYMMLNFFAHRFIDPAYRYEQALNGMENWEDEQCYLDVCDPVQYKEFWDGFEKVAEEDKNWVNEQRDRFGMRQDLVDEFVVEKNRLLIRDVTGKADPSANEEELITLQKRITSILPIKALIDLPGTRTRTEFIAFARGALAAEAAVLGVAAAAGAFATVGGLIVIGVASLSLPIWFGSRFVDKGVYEKQKGREKAETGGPLVKGLGGISIGGFALGMYGKRLIGRSATNISSGYRPLWDSAVPIEQLMKVVKLYKDNLRPLEFGERG